MFSIADLAIVNILFAITLWLFPQVKEMAAVRTLWVLVNASCLPVMLWVSRKPHQQRVLLMDHVVKHAFATVGIHALFFFSLIAFLDISELPIDASLAFYSMMAAAIPLWWIISRRIIKALRRHGYNFLRVVIVGTGPMAMRLLEELQSDAGFGYKVLGFVANEPPGPDFTEHYLGTISDLAQLARDTQIDQVFYTLSGRDEASLSQVVKIADENMIMFYYVPQISRRVARSFELNSVGVMPVLSVRRNPLNSPINRVIKRAFDVAFSSVMLVLSPLVVIPVAIAIKSSSPGPVFFSQERTGYKGRTFRCWKFRTMRVNDTADVQQATSADPRTTRVGRFLRRTSIDELPQFLNVWLGHMSVVGPRPHMLAHTEIYTRLIDKYMVRHVVKPGITGWAQVNGYRGATDELWKMERRVECDTWYIEHWSLFLDLKIVVRTIINAFKGDDNAY